jgi:hypothetical protein
MLNLEGTAVGNALEKRFADIRDEPRRELLRGQLIGATTVRHTLALRRAKAGDGSQQADFIRLLANLGVDGDIRASGVTSVAPGAEPVLTHVFGMAGGKVINMAQVHVTDLSESGGVAARLGVGHLPYGVQSENIILDRVYSREHELSGVSELPPGTVMTFMSPDGALRTASLYVACMAAPYPNAHELIGRHYSQVVSANTYAHAARGAGGVATMVKTSGSVHAGDVALIWKSA